MRLSEGIGRICFCSMKYRGDNMKVTIQDVADHAGVSIATVSHIINKTRYVRPELVEKVEQAIRETGYEGKKKMDNSGMRFGKQSKVAFVVPRVNSTIFGQLVTFADRLLREKGYMMQTHVTNDSIGAEREILTSLLADKGIAGILLIPSAKSDKIYRKVKKSRKPFVCLERSIDDPELACVQANNEHAVYQGIRHLIRNGHHRIGILLEISGMSTGDERLQGYLRAMGESHLEVDRQYIKYIDIDAERKENIFHAYGKQDMPTAFLACGNTLTYILLHDIDNQGLNCPQDISVIGFGDDKWSDVFNPPLTILTQRLDKMAEKSVELLLKQMDGIPYEIPIERIPIDFRVRKSTRVMNRGPFGERAFGPEELLISEEEARLLREKKFKVALAFQNTNTYWSILQEQAIRDTLGKYDVQVVTVMDANYDPKLQIAQLNAIEIQKPDALIGISVDEKVTAERFKTISQKLKLVLIGNLPEGFSQKDYYSCVSINEKENGQNAGSILGEFFKNKEYANIGLIVYGLPFRMTRQRDEGAEQAIRDNYPNLHIVSKKSFQKIADAYGCCREMIQEHPEIDGIYVSWERPAIEVIQALEDMDRTDISLSTVDLDMKVASYMFKGKMVRGLSAQRPYEQGQAAAMVTIQALLGKEEYKYVEIQPVRVDPHELPRVWSEITKRPIPDFIYQDQSI